MSKIKQKMVKREIKMKTDFRNLSSECLRCTSRVRAHRPERASGQAGAGDGEAGDRSDGWED